MRLSNSEHPILAGNPDLASLASSSFGKDASELLIDALIASYDMGHDYLPVLSPIETVAVNIQENVANRPVEGRAQLRAGSMSLGLNIGSSVEDIIMELPDAVAHEAAHLVHIQRNPLFFISRREANKLHFGSAIMEGVAAYAGRKLGAFSIYTESMFRQQKVIDALAQLLENPNADQYASYEEFMLGTKDFSNRGYRVGEFVVANIAKEMSLSTLELTRLPLDEFNDYAQTLV